MQGEVDLVVNFEMSESYKVVLGPPGARGMPETGRIVHPADDDPSSSSSALSEIHRKAEEAGIALTSKESKREGQEKRFDAGISTEFMKWLSAAGAGGAVLAFLKRIEPFVLQWMKNRAGRTLTIKTPKWTLTAKGGGEIKELIGELEKKIGSEK